MFRSLSPSQEASGPFGGLQSYQKLHFSAPSLASVPGTQETQSQSQHSSLMLQTLASCQLPSFTREKLGLEKSRNNSRSHSEQVTEKWTLGWDSPPPQKEDLPCSFTFPSRRERGPHFPLSMGLWVPSSMPGANADARTTEPFCRQLQHPSGLQGAIPF